MTFDAPTWKPGDTSMSPHLCPICGSMGTARYMFEHIESSHITEEALELLVHDSLLRARQMPQGVAYVSVITPEQMQRVEWDKLWPHEQAEQIANEYLYKMLTPDLVRVLQERLDKAIGPGWRVHTDVDPSMLSIDPPEGYLDWLREQPPKNGPGPTPSFKLVPGVVK